MKPYFFFGATRHMTDLAWGLCHERWAVVFAGGMSDLHLCPKLENKSDTGHVTPKGIPFLISLVGWDAGFDVCARSTSSMSPQMASSSYLRLRFCSNVSTECKDAVVRFECI